MKDSRCVSVRIGGIGYDHNTTSPNVGGATTAQLVALINNIQSNGGEPIVQIDYADGFFTSTDAANVVTAINITSVNSGAIQRKVKYWMIGNEPDGQYSLGSPAHNTAAGIAAYTIAFSIAMKSVTGQSDIKIIAPELTYYRALDITNNKEILTDPIFGLLIPGGTNDITGYYSTGGFYYVDYISFHYYPFRPSAPATRATVISTITDVGGFGDPSTSTGQLSGLNNLLATANGYRTSPLQIAITEGNINTKNPADLSNGGLSANSFIAGQFWAEMLASCMKNSVQFMNFWSVIEGDINLTPPDPEDKGYLRMSDASKRSTWFHFNFLANNFKGTFSDGTVSPSGTPYFCKAFGSYNSDQTAVLIMNQRSTGGSYTYRVRLDGGTVSGSETEKINIPGPNLAIEYASTIDDESTTLLVFDSKGVLSSKTEYKLSDGTNAPTSTCGNSYSMATQGSFDSYTPGIYSDITIGGTSAITMDLNITNNSLYRAANSITIPISAEFTVPSGKEFIAIPTSCY